jgi:ribose transport system ATP-binding protein
LSAEKPILSLKGINKSFSGVPVLQDVSLDLYSGEVHCLLGENGAGKSTLIKIISGSYLSDSGEIIYQDEKLVNMNPRMVIDKGIHTIYQEIDLVPILTASENISLGNEPITKTGNVDQAAMRQRAQKVFDEMGVTIDTNKPVGELKVAQQQMVAIAKALSMHSKIIILDEPTAVFTSNEIDVLFELINKLKERGTAILYISHHLDEIFRIGDRITVLRDGKRVQGGLVNEFDKNSLVKAMIGREINFMDLRTVMESGDEALKVDHVSRNGAVDDVSLTLHHHEIVGVAGLVGAGRTELGRLIIGIDKMDAGDIYLHGKKVKITSPEKALKLGMGMLPESRKEEGIVPVRSMGENFSYSVVVGSARYGLVAWKKIREMVTGLIKSLEVRPDNPNILIMNMSGGNQQKVVLGKWLAAKANILILDEPTRGVDVGARTEIYKLIQTLKEEGKAILMISSDLTEILSQSDRILVMAKGKIVGEFSAEEATEELILSCALQLGGGPNGSC